jgi:hypothetical protein
VKVAGKKDDNNNIYLTAIWLSPGGSSYVGNQVFKGRDYLESKIKIGN